MVDLLSDKINVVMFTYFQEKHLRKLYLICIRDLVMKTKQSNKTKDAGQLCVNTTRTNSHTISQDEILQTIYYTPVV